MGQSFYYQNYEYGFMRPLSGLGFQGFLMPLPPLSPEILLTGFVGNALFPLADNLSLDVTAAGSYISAFGGKHQGEYGGMFDFSFGLASEFKLRSLPHGVILPRFSFYPMEIKEIGTIDLNDEDGEDFSKRMQRSFSNARPNIQTHHDWNSSQSSSQTFSPMTPMPFYITPSDSRRIASVDISMLMAGPMNQLAGLTMGVGINNSYNWSEFTYYLNFWL